MVDGLIVYWLNILSIQSELIKEKLCDALSFLIFGGNDW